MNTGKQLIIIEKYEDFSNYIYLVLQNIPRKHGILKEKIIQLVFEQVELFYKAIKSDSKSRLYEADANLASIRFYLRFLANENRKLISQKQHQTASIKLAEVGKILNSWKKK
ncbi:diversity-generating retroelement protein Avd [Aliarcobacter butzleri]|uniref:diversity-generating retroelement protein Avd n=1 Tax=Aliarcobacter butzleri TaxID=28197 RepID=UPI0021B18367|nr:diversity-generating retroelement protein Avd [Aliarcobacter butzleri]MCT7549804.1 diversity-generating retroelement protein Avd [Aliarcobacter butzleri]MCT7559886.1 diversity-generating retroelement protein Avd [Aliarcobacter butzleri]